jgi:hypothetical protein
MFVRLHLSGKKLSMVARACHPSDGEKCQIGSLQSRITRAKKAGGVPSKHEAVRSTPGLPKKFLELGFCQVSLAVVKLAIHLPQHPE